MFFFANFWLLKVICEVPNAFKTISSEKNPIFPILPILWGFWQVVDF